jgi:hypothetical protein
MVDMMKAGDGGALVRGSHRFQCVAVAAGFMGGYVLDCKLFVVLRSDIYSDFSATVDLWCLADYTHRWLF